MGGGIGGEGRGGEDRAASEGGKESPWHRWVAEVRVKTATRIFIKSPVVAELLFMFLSFFVTRFPLFLSLSAYPLWSAVPVAEFLISSFLLFL